MKKNHYLIIISMTLFYIGCSSSNIQVLRNNELAKQKSPTRLIEDKTYENKNAIRYIEGWAGIKKESNVNNTFKEKTFKELEKICGYGKKDFIESRTVQNTRKNNHYIIEEVWLFNDPKSLRNDKISGWTILFTYNPTTNFTTVDFFGECHTKANTSFTISK